MHLKVNLAAGRGPQPSAMLPLYGATNTRKRYGAALRAIPFQNSKMYFFHSNGRRFRGTPNSVRMYARDVNEPEEQRVERWNFAKLLGLVAIVGVAVGIAFSAQFSVVVWAIPWLIS